MTGGLELELIGLEAPADSRNAALVLNGAPPEEASRAARWARALHPGGARPHIVAVDGGALACRAAGLRADRFAGDGDSLPGPPDAGEVHEYPRDKDFSDMAGALRELRAEGLTPAVVVAGLLGGRVDHEWANLLELGVAAPGFAGLVAPTPRGTAVVTARGVRARAAAGSLLSLFALGGTARISLSGTRWELRDEILAPGSRGLSNLSRATVTLSVHDGAAMLVFPNVSPDA